jgi:hypothetical protein
MPDSAQVKAGSSVKTGTFSMMFYLCITISIFLLMEILVFDSHRLSHAYGAYSLVFFVCPRGHYALAGKILSPALVIAKAEASQKSNPERKEIAPLSLPSGRQTFYFANLKFPDGSLRPAILTIKTLRVYI